MQTFWISSIYHLNLNLIHLPFYAFLKQACHVIKLPKITSELYDHHEKIAVAVNK